MIISHYNQQYPNVFQGISDVTNKVISEHFENFRLVTFHPIKQLNEIVLMINPEQFLREKSHLQLFVGG